MLPISERNARTIDTQINFTSTMKNLDTTYSEFFFFCFVLPTWVERVTFTICS